METSSTFINTYKITIEKDNRVLYNNAVRPFIC